MAEIELQGVFQKFPNIWTKAFFGGAKFWREPVLETCICHWHYLQFSLELEL